MVVRRRTWLGCTRPWQKRPPVGLYSHKAPPSYHPKGERDTKSPIKKGGQAGKTGRKNMSNEKTLLFWFELLRTCTVVTFSLHAFSQGVHVCVSHLFLLCLCVLMLLAFFLISFIVLSRIVYDVYALSLSFHVLSFVVHVFSHVFHLFSDAVRASCSSCWKRMIRKGYTATDRNHAIPNDHTAARNNYPSSLLPYAIKMQEASALERMKSPHNPSYWATNLEIQTSGLKFLIKTSNPEVEPHLSSILNIHWLILHEKTLKKNILTIIFFTHMAKKIKKVMAKPNSPTPRKI